MLGPTDEVAYAAGPAAVLAHDLASGDRREVAGSFSDVWGDDWFADLHDRGARSSPAGTWSIGDPDACGDPRLHPVAGGEPVDTGLPTVARRPPGRRGTPQAERAAHQARSSSRARSSPRGPWSIRSSSRCW